MAATPKRISVTWPFAVFSMEADTDYVLARWIASAGIAVHGRAGYFAQAACEKYLKAVKVQATQSYLETHALLKLAEDCQDVDPYFGEDRTRNILKQFDEFEQVGRYGGAANFDPKAVKNPNFQAIGMWIWKGNYLDDLDGFVFKTRGLLDFTKGNFKDSFPSIQRGQKKASLDGTWQGRPPLRVVLTKNNRFFNPL